MSRYLCTSYKGHETWDKPTEEWSEHVDFSEALQVRGDLPS